MFEKYKISKFNKQFGIKKRYFLFFYKWLTRSKTVVHNKVGYTSTEVQTFTTTDRVQAFTTTDSAAKKIKSLKKDI